MLFILKGFIDFFVIYNVKIHPVFFFNIPILKFPSQIKLFWDFCQNDVVLHRPLPLELIDKTVLP